MAPLGPLLHAVLALTPETPSNTAPWHFSTTAIGSFTTPLTLASRPGPSPVRSADTTTSTTIAAVSTHLFSSATALLAAAPSTTHFLELRQDSTTCSSGYVPCSNPAGIICVGSTQFGICAMNNCALVQDLAPGADCSIFSPITYSGPFPAAGPAVTSSSEALSPSTGQAYSFSTMVTTVAKSPKPQAVSSEDLGLYTSPTRQAESSLSAPSFATGSSLPASSPATGSSLPASSSATGSSLSASSSVTGSSLSASPSATGSAVQYTAFTGDGTSFPNISSWVSSFDSMWDSNLNMINTVCTSYGANSPAESAALKAAISSAASGSNLDPRFIFALVMQESRGCVRVITTMGAHANPGLLQDYNGPNSCAGNGTTDAPCPNSEISGMINDGVFGDVAPGRATGVGLMQNYQSAGTMSPVTPAAQYYITARIYNSGSYVQNDLGCGVATHCYASDVANRLSGWVGDSSPCNSEQVFANCSSS